MYRIAEAKGVENLIAGAWGCGVFMQDPSTVATLLVNAARNYNILQFPQFQNFLGGFGKMFKQLIIARRDLNMSPGKLAAQVSHASIAFLLEKLYWGSISFIINIVLILLLLTACVEENNRYPRLEYIPTIL